MLELCHPPPRVREAVVSDQTDSSGARSLIAHVVRADLNLGQADLVQWLAARLPEYMVPRSIGFLDELPLTPSGKIDRAALPPIRSDKPKQSPADRRPRTDAERALAEQWCTLLRIEDAGLDDDFNHDSTKINLNEKTACRSPFSISIS